jgi:hypothetical protein
MQRRTLLKVGIGAGVLLSLAGGTLALLQPARRDGRLTPAAQTMIAALARAVLAGLLPSGATEQATALQGLVQRIEQTIAGMPPAMQAEVDELLTIAASAPGRIGLLGLTPGWAEASNEQVTQALQALRTSSLGLRQQAFHALRDIINAAWFADSATWASIGYPGPRALGAAEPTKA